MSTEITALKEERDRLDAIRRAAEEDQCKAREAREDEERAARRAQQDIEDADDMLRIFLERFGAIERYAAVSTTIRIYLETTA